MSDDPETQDAIRPDQRTGRTDIAGVRGGDSSVGQRRPATIADVAEKAGVSIATVSNVVNGTRSVRHETRDRVLRAIEELNFAPNQLASALRKNSSGSLAFVVSDISNPYFADLISSVEVECRRLGFTLHVGDSCDDSALEEQLIRAFLGRRMVGLLISPTARANSALLEECMRDRCPVVVMDRLVPGMRVDQVGIENESSTRLAVEHLASIGHTRIAFVAGLPGISTTTERLTGYRSALADAGLPLQDDLLAWGGSRTQPAQLAVRRLLASQSPPTAVMAANNLMAIGTLKALREAGLRPGRDVAVIGFDDFEWSELLDPPLTAIRQPTRAIGRRVVDMLTERLADSDLPPRMDRLVPQFVHRSSCGCELNSG